MYNDTISNSAKGCTSTRQLRAMTPRATPPTRRSCSTTRSTTTRSASRRISPQFDGTERLRHRQHAGDEQHLRRRPRRLAVNMNGQAGDSQLQYNLFLTTSPTCSITTTDGDFGGNVGQSSPTPNSWGPSVPATPPLRTSSSSRLRRRSTRLAAKSDRTRRQCVYPTVDLTLNGGVVTETRTDPATLT